MYNCLPSEIMQKATTFDLMVTDVYTAWEKYKSNPNDQTQYNSDNLAEILKSARGK